MKLVTTLFCALTFASLVGCSNMTPAEQSVLSGSALGALGGAALGSLSGNAGDGALIGAGIGAIGGAMQESNNRGRDARAYEQGYRDARHTRSGNRPYKKKEVVYECYDEEGLDCEEVTTYYE